MEPCKKVGRTAREPARSTGILHNLNFCTAASAAATTTATVNLARRKHTRARARLELTTLREFTPANFYSSGFSHARDSRSRLTVNFLRDTLAPCKQDVFANLTPKNELTRYFSLRSTPAAISTARARDRSSDRFSPFGSRDEAKVCAPSFHLSFVLPSRNSR